MNTYGLISGFLFIKSLKALCLTALLVVGLALQSEGQRQTYCAVMGVASGNGSHKLDGLETTGGTTNIDFEDDRTLSEMNGGMNPHLHVTGQRLTIAQGAAFNLAVTSAKSRTLIWIDWNGDRDFEDEGEFLSPPLGAGSEEWVGSTTSTNRDIDVPSDATIGMTRMRIVNGDAWAYEDANIPPTAELSPCGERRAASVYDFNVTIEARQAGSFPVATAAPATATVAEDSENNAISGLSITDANSSDQTVTFSVTGGTLTIGTTDIAFSDGSNGSASFKASGTLAAINTALDAATFTPTPDLRGDGAARIAFSSRDAEGTSNEVTVTVNITPVNDAPTLTANATSADPLVVNQGRSAHIPTTKLNATDIDHDDTGLTFTLTANPAKGQLRNDGTALDAGTSTNTFTQADINNNQITYLSNVTGGNGLGEDTFTFTVSDEAGGELADQNFYFRINSVSASAPTAIDLRPATIAENSSASIVVGELITTDTEQDRANAYTYELVAGTGDTDNASFDIGTGEDDGKLIIGVDASFDYETNDSYSVRVQVTDDDGNVFAQALAINVTDVNEAPSVSIASPTMPLELVENSENNDILGLSITDPEGDDQTVTFSVIGGTLTIGTVDITFSDGSNGSASFEASGTLAAINAALNAATFTPTPDLSGDGVASIAFSSRDAEGTSNEVTVIVNITEASYCAVTGAASGNGSHKLDGLETTGGTTNIDFDDDRTLSEMAGDMNLHLHVTGQRLTIAQGAAFNLAVTSAKSRTLIWIDWNGDRDFEDEGEFLSPPLGAGSEEWVESTTSTNRDIDVPSDATIGMTRMRIVNGDAWAYEDANIPPRAELSPCGERSAASVYDFNVTIEARQAGSFPVATVASATATVAEDSENNAISGLSITDANSSDQTVTFSVTGGTLTIGTTDIAFSDGSNGSASFKASGTLAAINTALDAATFTPTPDLSGDGAARIAFSSRDADGTSNEVTVTVNITPSLVVELSYCAVMPTGDQKLAQIVTARAASDIAYPVEGSEVPSGYTLVAEQQLTVARGTNFTLTITQAEARSFVWIDWNRDEVFELSERLPAFGASAVWVADATPTFHDVTVPNDAAIGATRMRVLTGDAWSHADVTDDAEGTAKVADSPCGDMSNASIKDFSVMITASLVPSAPIAVARTSPVVVEEDATNVDLSDDLEITDTNSSDQTVTFTVMGGTFTIGTTDIAFSDGSNGSASFKASGTLAAINTALDAATFTPTPDLSGDGAASIAFSSRDADGTSNEVTVIVNITESSVKILTFSVPEAVSGTTADINDQTHRITVKVPTGTDVTALVAIFTLSPDATAQVGTTEQESGMTSNDFTSPVTYTVTADDRTQQAWTVEMQVVSQEAQIKAFSISGQSQVTTVNEQSRTVTLGLPHGTDVAALVASFTLSEGATAKVGDGDNSVDQVSGTTPNDFTSPVRYIVMAEDGVTESVFTVTVTLDASPTLNIEVMGGGITAYPIPASGQLHIKMDNEFRGQCSIVLKNAVGQHIHHHTTNKQKQVEEVSVPLTGCPYGIYLLEVVCQERRWAQKVIKGDF